MADVGRRRPLAASWLLPIITGCLLAFGVLTVFSGLGVPFLIGALVLLGLILSKAARLKRMAMVAVTAVLFAGIFGYGSEHLVGPDCSRSGSLAGETKYSTGAIVTWKCIDGKPVVTRDTRGWIYP
jgi:hydrogenase/urease accessory protein HupE